MTLTEILILFVSVLLLVYTGMARRIGQRTVSMTMRDLGWKYNSIPFALGIVIGHWFFPNFSLAVTNKVGFTLPFIALVLGFDLLWRRVTLPSEIREWWRWPGWWFCYGIPVGMIFWSQGPGVF